MFAHCLEQPTRTASLTLPCGVFAFRRTARAAVPIRSCSRWGLPCRLRCRRRGALLPHHFTLTAAIRYAPRRYPFCCTFPETCPRREANSAGRYPAPYIRGARTFLPGDLSVLAGAAVQPTDAARDGDVEAARQAPIIQLINGQGLVINAAAAFHYGEVRGAAPVRSQLTSMPHRGDGDTILHRKTRALVR